VISIFDLSTNIATSSGMFNVQYQFVLNNIYDLTNYNTVHYYMSMENLQFMEKMLVGSQPIRYNRHMNRLYIDANWDTIEIGTYIVAECYSIVDPDTIC
jgi:hypothetical protein